MLGGLQHCSNDIDLLPFPPQGCPFRLAAIQVQPSLRIAFSDSQENGMNASRRNPEWARDFENTKPVSMLRKGPCLPWAQAGKHLVSPKNEQMLLLLRDYFALFTFNESVKSTAWQSKALRYWYEGSVCFLSLIFPQSKLRLLWYSYINTFYLPYYFNHFYHTIWNYRRLGKIISDDGPIHLLL